MQSGRLQACYHWLVGPGDIRLEYEEFDPNDLADDEVLCRTQVSAISPGTELAAFAGLEALRPEIPTYPRWLGYMNVAEIVRAGRNAQTEFPEGTLIYSNTAHRSHFRLDKSKILGVLSSRHDPADASLAYLYRLAWVGLRRGRGEVGRDVAVLGLGAIGQCAAELAMRFGSNCLGISDHANARQLLREVGGSAIGRIEAEQRFVSVMPGEDQRFDIVVVTTNTWRDWHIALALARFGGIISVIGFPGRGQPGPDVNPLLPALFYDRQLTIMSAGLAGSAAGQGREDISVRTRDIRQILAWIDAETIVPSRLCMGMHPARDLAGAYGRLSQPDRAPGTIVLDWRADG